MYADAWDLSHTHQFGTANKHRRSALYAPHDRNGGIDDYVSRIIGWPFHVQSNVYHFAVYDFRCPADCRTGRALVGQFYLADKRIIDFDFLSAISLMNKISDFPAFNKPKLLFAYFGKEVPLSLKESSIY